MYVFWVENHAAQKIKDLVPNLPLQFPRLLTSSLRLSCLKSSRNHQILQSYQFIRFSYSHDLFKTIRPWLHDSLSSKRDLKSISQDSCSDMPAFAERISAISRKNSQTDYVNCRETIRRFLVLERIQHKTYYGIYLTLKSSCYYRYFHNFIQQNNILLSGIFAD